MYRRIIVLSLLITLAPLVARASDSSYEKAIARGLAATENNDHAAAAAEFRAALAERPDDPEATLYLGIAQSRAKSVEAESTLKKALANDPANPRTNLELGILYLNRGVKSEAEDYFEDTVRIAPDSAQAVNAREYLRLLKAKVEEKKWGVRLLTGLQYDSNVLLDADGTPLPAGVTDRADWRGIVNLGLTYAPVQTGRFDLGLSYQLYQSFHFHLDQFDINQNQIEVTGKYSFNDRLALKAGYAYEYQFIGGDGYAGNNIGNASFIVNGPAGTVTSIDYRYRDTGYKNSQMFMYNHDRSGSNHQIGLTGKMPLGDSILLKAGYFFDKDSTRADYWDYTGHKGLAGITARLPFSLVTEVTGEAYLRDYDAPFPAAGVSRKDTSMTASFLLSRFFGKMFSLTAGVYYNRNDSNIQAFDYDRMITSLLAQVRF